MFTGLVEKIGRVEKIILDNSGGKIFFKASFENIVALGASIAVNGVCLTVTQIQNDIYCVDVMKETLNLTNLSNLKVGDLINLEQAMKADSRFDGHIVQGHIDCVARVKSIINDGFSKRFKFQCENELIIYKGSIAINGVSLTVSKILDDGFEVSLIPATLEHTNLSSLKLNDCVNIEFDVLGKYLKRFLEFEKKEDKFKITKEYLIENGF